MKAIMLVFIFLISSCGKNAFLKATKNIIGAISQDSELISFRGDGLDFAKVSKGDVATKKIEVVNIGNTDFYIEQLLLTGVFRVINENCSGQKIDLEAACELTVEFDTRDLASGKYEEVLEVIIDDSSSHKAIIKGEVTSPIIIEEDDELIVSYLDGDAVDFGLIHTNSSYEKLVYIEPIGKTGGQITGFSNSGSTEAVFYSGYKSCSARVSSGCFIKFSLSPNAIGKFSEEINISYINNNQMKTLKIPVRYRVKERDQCAAYTEKIYSAKLRSEYTDEETSMSFPYKNRPYTSAKLESVINDAYTRYVSTGDLIYKFNENTQVFMSFGVKKLVGKFVAGRLLFDLSKYEDLKNDSYDTEVLCNLDYQTCSGKRFTNRSFKKLINKKFKVKNNKFSKFIVSKKKRICEGLNFYETKTSFNLAKYLGIGSKKISHLLKKKGTVSFVVADDIRLNRKPFLVLKIKKSCSE